MRQLIADLKADTGAYHALGHWYSQPGFWIVAVYRFGMWAKRLPPGLSQLAWLVYRLLHLPYFFFNVQLWAGKGGCQLGPGLCLVHANNIYFGPGVKVGADCLIHHEVTLGMGAVPGTPQLGDRVVVYPGARLQGGIVLGNDAIIGANCVVARHVAPGTVVLPAPNRTLPRNLSPTARQRTAEADTPAPD